MEKKLPGVFQNPIEHPVHNNKEYFYSSKEGDTKENKPTSLSREELLKREVLGSEVEQKINQIFSSPNYIYKADVVIRLKDETLRTKIIGRNKGMLITIDNRVIAIDDIKDIELQNEKGSD